MFFFNRLCGLPYPSPSGFVADCLVIIGSCCDIALGYWIAAMAFDISWTFLHFHNASESSKRFQFLFYCIFVYCTTFIFTICIIAFVVIEYYSVKMVWVFELVSDAMYWVAIILFLLGGLKMFEISKALIETERSRFTNEKNR
jgi:hypothetical protein